MLHLLMGQDPWFAPKRYGYGAGWPLCWQGWLLLGSYLSIIAGSSRLARGSERVPSITFWLILGISTLVVGLIARRRTRGGWRWRWGEAD